MNTENTKSVPQKKASLLDAIWNRRMLICLFNGFTAGLPLYFILQYVPAWLRTEEVDLKTIGLFSLVQLPYTFKIFWAPMLDTWVPPFLGRRRGWMLITQIGCLLSMLGLVFFNPAENIQAIVVLVVIMAVFSATQDVALDAYRRELLPDNELGLGNSFYQNAYRVAGFIPGGLGLILADYLSWSFVHVVIAAFMFVGIIHTMVIREVSDAPIGAKNFKSAYLDPFLEFFQRDGGLRHALLILAFMFCYKLGDTMATALATPFYIDMGFTLTQIGSLIKLTNFWSMLVGSFLGGVYIYKFGINKSLWVFGFMQLLTIFGFAWLSMVGDNVSVLIVVLVLEYLAAGLGTSAFMAYIAKASNKAFTGTQLAMFSALFALTRSFASATTGYLIEGVSAEDGIIYDVFGQLSGLGWTHFFYLCAALAMPGMILLYWVAPWSEEKV